MRYHVLTPSLPAVAKLVTASTSGGSGWFGRGSHRVMEDNEKALCRCEVRASLTWWTSRKKCRCESDLPGLQAMVVPGLLTNSFVFIGCPITDGCPTFCLVHGREVVFAMAGSYVVLVTYHRDSNRCRVAARLAKPRVCLPLDRVRAKLV